MRANVSKRGITTTATEDNTAQSVNSTPQTSILVSEDVKLAPTRAINLPSRRLKGDAGNYSYLDEDACDDCLCLTAVLTGGLECPTGFSLLALITTLGLILAAVYKEIETYYTTRVFYSASFTGIMYSVDIITADTSSMRDRGLAFAFTSSPYIITAFGGPKAV
ncbi:hypothetical protein B0J12DRAFT_771506 [Macrophomina phaseolina]|uniref:Uncharacterized protein n=1 Tax=Macrophomina phaseolina TaxID=35725 RepID=A0ABQ8FUY6_9PEZI|nr:hypothetical protein B0J12DRAFT_771506 [Macrophomina phaseolina]